MRCCAASPSSRSTRRSWCACIRPACADSPPCRSRFDDAQLARRPARPRHARAAAWRGARRSTLLRHAPPAHGGHAARPEGPTGGRAVAHDARGVRAAFAGTGAFPLPRRAQHRRQAPGRVRHVVRRVHHLRGGCGARHRRARDRLGARAVEAGARPRESPRGGARGAGGRPAGRCARYAARRALAHRPRPTRRLEGPLPARPADAGAEDPCGRRRARRQHQDVSPLARPVRRVGAERPERVLVGHAAAEGRLRVLGPALMAIDVDDLVARMTLAEKAAQLGGVWVTDLVTDDRFDEAKARHVLRHGTGHVTRIGASTGLGPRGSAELANAVQRVLVEETRLGIPAVIHEESTGGFCARGATQFPQAIGLGSTWDPALVERIGGVIRRQMRAVGASHTLAPVLDVGRDPRWGRVEETYGEDPYLCGTIGTAYVRGVQGDDLAHGIACTGKHFLGYGLSEGGMNHAPVHLGPRELREVFAEPFAAAIRDAGLASIMNSYTSIDGLPCAGSHAILTALLRDELGFTGVVVADHFSVMLLRSWHRVAGDKADAARRALEAGLDVELPAFDCYREIPALVAAGRLDEALVDRACRRALAHKRRLGLFERPYVDAGAAPAAFDTPDDRALARLAAARSICLLTND